MVLLSIANGTLKSQIVLFTGTIMKTMGKLPILRVVYVEEDWVTQVLAQLQLSPPLQSPLIVLRPLLLNARTNQRGGMILTDHIMTVNGIVWVTIVKIMAMHMQTMA